jgi:hypothetical protein
VDHQEHCHDEERTLRTGQAVFQILPGAMEAPLQVVSWASQQGEGQDNHHIYHWKEGGACHIGHSLEMPEVDSHEGMRLGPQSHSSQSETRTGEVDEEAHAFCNHPHHPCEQRAEDNRGSLAEETLVFLGEDNRTSNEHHGEEADNLEGDTLHDRQDIREHGERVLHNHAADEFYRLRNRLPAGLWRLEVLDC